MTYEHLSHKAARDANAVPPVIDLTGWDRPAATVKSCAGQLALPGLELPEDAPINKPRPAKRAKGKWFAGGVGRKRRF